MLVRYDVVENRDMFKCKSGAWVKYNDYEKLKNKYEYLRKEITNLSIESIERQKEIGKLEVEIMFMRKWSVIKTKGDGENE